MNEFKKEPDAKIKSGEIRKNIESYFKELNQKILEFEKIRKEKKNEN